MSEVFIIIIIVMTGIVITVFVDIFISFHNRKCPYCRKRMKYAYKKEDDDGNLVCWVFHCPNCGAWEEVTPEQLEEDKS